MSFAWSYDRCIIHKHVYIRLATKVWRNKNKSRTPSSLTWLNGFQVVDISLAFSIFSLCVYFLCIWFYLLQLLPRHTLPPLPLSLPAPLSTCSNFFPLINSFSEFSMHSHIVCQTFSWILFVFAHTHAIPPLVHFVCICETTNELIMQQVKCTETFCCCHFYDFTLELCDSQPTSQHSEI